jgi:hypothetical protein
MRFAARGLERSGMRRVLDGARLFLIAELKSLAFIGSDPIWDATPGNRALKASSRKTVLSSRGSLASQPIKTRETRIESEAMRKAKPAREGVCSIMCLKALLVDHGYVRT